MACPASWYVVARMALGRYIAALESGEDFLLRRVMVHSFKADYTRYTSTHEEDWRMAVREPRNSLVAYLRDHEEPDPIRVDEDLGASPAAAFGIVQAQRHRARGVSFDMFLGLSKLIRDAFLELVAESGLSGDEEKRARAITIRFFDKFELGFCTAWVRHGPQDAMVELQETNRKITNVKTRYQTVFRSLTDPALLLNKDRQIVDHNEALEALLGLPASAISGRDCRAVLPCPSCRGCPMEHGLAGVGPFHDFEVSLIFGDAHRVFLMSGSPLCDISRKNEGLVAFLKDVTARRRAEEKLRAALADADEGRKFLEALMEQVPEGIAISDALTGRIRWVSQYGRELTGKPPEQIEGIFLDEQAERWDLYRPDGRTRPRSDELPLVRATQEGRVVRGDEWVLGTPSGERIPVLCNAGPIRGSADEIVGGVMTWHDLREKKRAEEAEALREADRRKNEFLAVLSHELRNPLAPIRNSLFILDRAPTDPTKTAKARAVIRRQLDHLTRLVDDLLDVTRITHGKVRLRKERVDLRALVARLLEDFGDLYAAKGVALEGELPRESLWLCGDATRVSQVVANLLENGAKFTPPGGYVRLTLEKAGCTARLRIEDNGIGIEPEVLPRLFEPFTQASQTLDRTSGGLGLGLTLVKGLVELHGGSVAVQSPGLARGAEFTVAFPVDESQP